MDKLQSFMDWLDSLKPPIPLNQSGGRREPLQAPSGTEGTSIKSRYSALF